MYLTRTDGRVVELDDEKAIDRAVKKSGWRESNEQEIDNYEAKKAQLIAQTQRNTPTDGMEVYYQTVSSSPNGYGMSRDILKTELFTSGILMQEEYSKQKIGLLYSYPNTITTMQNDVRIIMTMFESDHIPDDWTDYLNMADEVIVPSKWCHDVFAESGIETTVIPLGYNDRVFTYQDRTLAVDTDRPFTFVHYNSFNMRKGFSEVFAAFTEEFKTNEPVKMILKTTDARPPLPILKSQYPNIEIITEKVTENELLGMLRQADCMVYPSRGEGFGITPLEAMATGLPTIVPNAHGISEYFNSNYMLEVKVEKRSPALYQRFKGQYVGNMVECDVKDLRKQMRYAYNHQKEMKDLGKSASDYVKKYTYRESARKLAELLYKWNETEVIKRKDTKHLKVEVV